MNFEAVVAEVREARGRVEVRFQGRPAFYWFEPETRMEQLIREAQSRATPVQVEWDPTDGRILSLSGDAR